MTEPIETRVKPPPGPPPPDRYMMQLKLGDPLPHDLPADAQRYRMVRKDSFRDRGPMALGIVVALVACGLCLFLLGFADAYLIALGVLVGLTMWWAREVPPVVRWVPDDRGDYVVEPHSVTAERLGALAAPERLPAVGRVFCVVAAAGLIVLAGLDLYDFLVGASEFSAIGSLMPLGVAASLLFVAIRNQIPSFETGEVPPSPLFFELADPSRPLSENAPIFGRSEGAASDGRSGRKV